MFIGEAPGRLGADETGIPFHGDKTGNNFEELLEHAGISREDVFVTNAVLCNPKDENGNNSTPSADEVHNCSGYLREQIDLVNPNLVVTLGATALAATKTVEDHQLVLREAVRTRTRWAGRSLIPLYHPGQRAMIHRSKANQRSDYQFVAEEFRRIGVKRRRASGKTSRSVAGLAREIIQRKGQVSYFALHKLMYLLDYLAVRDSGDRLTAAYYIRQKDGPYCTDLHLTKLERTLDDLVVRRRSGKIFLELSGAEPSLDLFGESDFDAPDQQISHLIDQVLDRYSYKEDTDLKRAVYLTAPMKRILRLEKRDKVNLYNAPIKFMEA